MAEENTPNAPLPTSPEDPGLQRLAITLTGIVQGVGMRPAIKNLADSLHLTGFVGNNDREVFIEAQGPTDALAAFGAQLEAHLPPLAHIIDRTERAIAPVLSDVRFAITESVHVPGARTLIAPDVSICDACLADINDPTNRRYHYPFTTCTDCGPRLSIIEDLPYDRPLTTMKDFPMCPACEAEYTDPHNRRFHAQPIACPDCGPHLYAQRKTSSGDVHTVDGTTDDLIALVHRAWDNGLIVAVKGIGGFHLMCDATNEQAIMRLRELKNRPHKPFAVMAPHPSDVAEVDATLVASPARPIIIAPSTGLLPDVVAPGLSDVGVMLPYSPLHYLLVDRPVVATSGNLGGQPLCFDNETALTELGHMADLFLMHDRGIHVPVEDSVYIAPSWRAETPSQGAAVALPSRRSRGYAPLPVRLPDSARLGPVVLGVGGELKNTFTLAVDDYAHVSAHVGDMGSWATQQAFERAVNQLVGMRKADIEVVVCDLHPDYSTTNWATRYADALDVDLIQVQHHHAHALSLLAEHGHTQGVVATLDGTGFGTDGTIWGGEILTVDGTAFSRAWHLPTFPLIGGDKAAMSPWRSAFGLCHELGLPLPVAPSPSEHDVVEAQLHSGIGVTLTSSTGRLFDAVAYLLGASEATITYEGQAAMQLEALARTHHGEILSDATTVTELLTEALESRRPQAARAARFHHGLATIIADQLREVASHADTDVIGVSGGCALNRLLLQHLRHHIPTLLEHRVVPANDGGLSLGHAVAGRLATQP